MCGVRPPVRRNRQRDRPDRLERRPLPRPGAWPAPRHEPHRRPANPCDRLHEHPRKRLDLHHGRSASQARWVAARPDQS